jgi:hypothetical protein
MYIDHFSQIWNLELLDIYSVKLLLYPMFVTPDGLGALVNCRGQGGDESKTLGEVHQGTKAKTAHL